MALLELVRELLTSAKLRKEFNADPSGVIDRAGLSDDQKAAFYSMDLEIVGEAVKQEIMDVDVDTLLEGEFPITSDMFLPEDDESDAEYPDITPMAFRWFPKTAKISKPKHEINIYGQSFSRDAKLVLTPKTGSGPDLTVKGNRVFGTYRCSQLRAVVRSPSAKGIYKMKIQNGSKLPHPPDPFEIGEFEFT